MTLQSFDYTFTTHTMRAVDYVTHGFGGMFSDLSYQLSPSGSASTLFNRGRITQDLESKYGQTARRWSSIGLNPKFIDIARGPNGKMYLAQGINFLETYINALPRNRYNANASYNTAASLVGTSSPLTPSRTLISNVTPDYYYGLLDFYRLVLNEL